MHECIEVLEAEELLSNTIRLLLESGDLANIFPDSPLELCKRREGSDTTLLEIALSMREARAIASLPPMYAAQVALLAQIELISFAQIKALQDAAAKVEAGLFAGFRRKESKAHSLGLTKASTPK